MKKNVLFEFIRQVLARLLNKNYIFKFLSDSTITYSSGSKKLFNKLFRAACKLINMSKSRSRKLIIYSDKYMHLPFYNIKNDYCNYLVKNNVTWGII
jgi:hypothetical protein